MKNIMKIQNLTLIALSIGFLALASKSFACGGYGMGYGPGSMHTQTDLTAEQQQKITTVKEKYGDQLEQLQRSLDQKTDQYRAARADDSTTVGTLKQLNAEISDLQQQYRSTLSKANVEAGGLLAYADGTWIRCYDDNQGHPQHWGMMEGGRHMGPGQMMFSDDADCWWD